MDTLTIKIRGNLRNYKEKVQADRQRYWLMIQVTVLITAAALLLLALIPKPWVLENYVPLVILIPMFLLASLMKFFSDTLNRGLQITLLSIIFILLSVAAGFLKPISPTTPSWIALAFPLVTWPMIFRLIQEVPHQARMYSLRPLYGYLVIVTAGLSGLTLGVHKFLLGRFIPWIGPVEIDMSFQTLCWMLGVGAGLIVPAEELLLRGAGFSVFHDDLEHSFNATAFRIAGLNTLLYLSLLLFTFHGKAALSSGLLALFYKAILSYWCTYLVLRWRNLYASAAANLLFLITAGQVFFL
jgi:hypothetical protein